MVRKDDIRQVDSVVRKLKLSKEQRKLLHRAIGREELTYRELLELAKAILEDFPRK
jgi:ATP phosphoribosyltransferase regulatory subunit HisZ